MTSLVKCGQSVISAIIQGSSSHRTKIIQLVEFEKTLTECPVDQREVKLVCNMLPSDLV